MLLGVSTSQSLLLGNPSLLLGVLAAIVFVVCLAKFFNAPKPDKNPFAKDGKRPLDEFVSKQEARDKVLKQGFLQKKVPDDLDAVVVGSGIGGLSVAAILAKIGKKVLVLEQHDQAGGCCHTFVEKGFEFDAGIHYIGEMNSNSLFKCYVDQLTEGQLQWADLDKNFDTVVLGPSGKQKSYQLQTGKTEFRQSLVNSFPDEEKAIDNYLDLLKKVRKSLLGSFLVKTLPLWLTKVLIATGLINYMTSYFKYSQLSLKKVMQDLTDNKELRAVLAYSFGDYGTGPRDASFAMHATLINHYMYGASYPRGGASEIAFHIIPVIEKAGGKVLVRAPVSQILTDSEGNACGVRVKRSSGDVDINAPIVISDAGVYNTYEKLFTPEMQAKIGFKKLEKKGVQHGPGAMSLFVGLKGEKEELGLRASNWWAFSEVDQDKGLEDYLAKSREEVGKDEVPLLFISFPSTKDPTWKQRYPGKSTCAVITLAKWDWFSDWEDGRVMHRGKKYEEVKNRIAERMWQQTCALFPQLKDKVEYFEIGSPLSNKYYIAAPKGEIYGIDHNKQRFSPTVTSSLRPETAIPNFFLTGQDIFSCGFAGASFGGLLCASKIINRNLFGDLMKLKNDITKGK